MKLKNIIIIGFLVILPFVVSAQTDNRAGGDCTTNPGTSLCNPIKASSLEGLLGNTLKGVGNLLGLVTIVIMVYAGVRLLAANGNDETIKEAKKAITYAVYGFLISVFAYAGIVALENFIGVETLKPSNANTLFNPFGSTNNLKAFVESVLANTIRLSGLVALLMIIMNGFRYLSARGDDKQVGQAKKGLTWSIAGLFIILFAYVIVSALARLTN